MKTDRYGSWISPITSELIVRDTVDLKQVLVDGEDVYWIERRPREGRDVLVRTEKNSAAHCDVLPPTFSARTTVHTYGGGAISVANGLICASNFKDQRLYRCGSGAEPVALTPAPDEAHPFGRNLRFADGVIDLDRNVWIGIREDHVSEPGHVINTIVAVDLEGGGPGRIIVSGADFYSSPKLSADGKKLAWLSWNHPNMPWIGTDLWIADWTLKGAVNPIKVAGSASESIFQPEWSPMGALYFVSDRSNWWNIYSWHDGRTTPLCEMDAEFGQAQWNFGMSTYACLDQDRVACSYSRNGLGGLALLDVPHRKLTPWDLSETDFASVRATAKHVVFLGASASQPRSVISLDLQTGARTVLRSAAVIDPEIQRYLTAPEPLEFPTAHAKTAYGLYYPPRNPDYSAPQGEKPPLLVRCHGGPTGAAASTLDLGIQFWTSRGVAVLDVNYGGSTGFGRTYRDRLHRQWGIVDVDDCVNGARYLADRGDIDGKRAVMSGGSAGGYTTLAALAFRKFFRGGASLYGISDVAALARDTHKFESRYMDWLVGPFPEEEAEYRARSPLFHAHQFEAPVIFFQGTEDRVVPQNQTEMMVEALRKRRVPVGYFLFVGEGHGFREADNIKRSLDGQLYFFDVTVFQSGLTFEVKKTFS